MNVDDLNFADAGCEPARGFNAGSRLVRRGFRRVLRPAFVKLGRVLQVLVNRLDAAEQRLSAGERELADRTALMERHGGRLGNIEPRLDDAEKRVDKAAWSAEVLFSKVEGLTNHLGGLSQDHLDLHSRVAERVVQIGTLTRSIEGMQQRHDELDETLQAVGALHWDHVALARRLAAIEDLLAIRGEASRGGVDEGEGLPTIPFPGFEDKGRSRVV